MNKPILYFALLFWGLSFNPAHAQMGNSDFHSKIIMSPLGYLDSGSYLQGNGSTLDLAAILGVDWARSDFDNRNYLDSVVVALRTARGGGVVRVIVNDTGRANRPTPLRNLLPSQVAFTKKIGKEVEYVKIPIKKHLKDIHDLHLRTWGNFKVDFVGMELKNR